MSHTKAWQVATFIGFLLFPPTTLFALAALLWWALDSLTRDAKELHGDWQAMRLRSGPSERELWAEERGEMRAAIAEQWTPRRHVDPQWDGSQVIYKTKRR